MKKLFLITLLLSTSAFAEHNEYRHEHHGYWQHGGDNGWTWVAPTIIGGVIGYEMARNQPQPQPQTVIIQQQVPPCSPWTEIQNPDGTITRTRTCTK